MDEETDTDLDTNDLSPAELIELIEELEEELSQTAA